MSRAEMKTSILFYYSDILVVENERLLEINKSCKLNLAEKIGKWLKVSGMAKGGKIKTTDFWVAFTVWYQIVCFVADNPGLYNTPSTRYLLIVDDDG